MDFRRCSTWENRGYVEVVAIRPPARVQKDPIVKAQMFHVWNGCGQGTQITQKNSQTKTLKGHSPLQKGICMSNSPPKTIQVAFIERVTEEVVCAMKARTWCSTSHTLNAYTIVVCRKRCRNRGRGCHNSMVCGCVAIREHLLPSSNRLPI